MAGSLTPTMSTRTIVGERLYFVGWCPHGERHKNGANFPMCRKFAPIQLWRNL
ncbi:hypothetical protein HMPREF0281_01861 [Corynebacterium ammoniagenes DSM 20306]|uniref:Uncharacterized protein n=1 Tax=Corynebacterium ammoniagenes DSM 20306 TaxID=649754 RepID=A0ABP2IBQ5_CORAM|nr:hypothetical protein HMPREF0281_01861 [Corynebacterium ammoniagenes DSM 20306]